MPDWLIVLDLCWAFILGIAFGAIGIYRHMKGTSILPWRDNDTDSS